MRMTRRTNVIPFLLKKKNDKMMAYKVNKQDKKKWIKPNLSVQGDHINHEEHKKIFEFHGT
jgi:hypothetical protein